MLQNYLKIALRNLLKNKTFSFINIAGLAVGLASTMILALWVLDEYSFENFQEKKGVLFQGKRNFKESETSIWTSSSQSGNTAEYIRKNFPEVKNAILTDWGYNAPINYGEKSLKKNWSSVETPFFEMFTFPFVKGSAKTAFTDINSVVLTESMAKALFGDEDPMNKLVKINLKHTLKVTGVLRDLPTNTRFKFDYLTSMKFLDSIGETYYGWSANNFQLWVELRPDANLEAVNKKMLKVYKSNADGFSNGDLFLYPLSRLRLYNRFNNGVESGEGLISLVSLFSIISIIILIIACINFMNLSTARSEKRAKEVGVRKVTGANRGSLIGLFLSESLLITILAFGLAILIVVLCLPAFNDLIEKQLVVPFGNINYILGAIILVVFTGFISGSYPAFFLSSFQPIKVLKGTLQMGRGASLPRKILVIVQFCFSIILVIFTILVYQQIRFGQNQPLGYDQKNLMYFEMPGEMYKQFTPLKQDLLASGVVVSAYSTNQPMNATGNNSWGYEWKGQKPEQKNQVFDNVRVTFDFLKTTGIKLKEGRDYSPQFMADTIHSVLVNEAAVKAMGLKNPLGEIIRRQGEGNYTIVGVLKDFVFGNPFEDKQPMMVQLMPNANRAANVVVRLNPQKSATECLEKISTIFKKYETAAPFDYQFVDTEFEKKFSKERLLSILAYLFGGLAIFVSCLGLFGLASFMAERRTKEIGIRKVLGASISGIVMMLSKDFLKLVGIATIISFPLAWLLGNKFLENYPKHINFAWWIFAVSGIMAGVIALLTVSYQAIKAAVANPVKSLRTE
jgi:putative ABC transport system permease protein